MFELVVIGASLGGLYALRALLSSLPGGFPAAVAVVQHRASDAEPLLGGLLQARIHLPLIEVEDKEPLQAGHVYLAPADYHLLVERGHFALSTEAPVWYARPSIDVLFESAAWVYGPRVVGVILTGANQDGAQGLAAIKARGGLAVVQDPASAEASAMPQAALAAAPVDRILRLEEIGPFLVEVCGARPTRARRRAVARST